MYGLSLKQTPLSTGSIAGHIGPHGHMHIQNNAHNDAVCASIHRCAYADDWSQTGSAGLWLATTEALTTTVRSPLPLECPWQPLPTSTQTQMAHWTMLICS